MALSKKRESELMGEAIAEDKARTTSGEDRASKAKLIKIITGLAIFVLIFLAITFYAPSNYRGPIYIAIIVGFLLALSKGKEFSMPGLTFDVVICTAIAIGIVMLMPFISPYASNVYAEVKTGNILAPFTCLINPVKCQQQYTEIWETKTTQILQFASIEVDFSNAIKREPLNIPLLVKVKTNEDLEMTPTCFLDESNISTTVPSGSTLKFTKSDQLQQSSVRCSSEKTFSDKLNLKLNTTKEKQVSAVVWLGQGGDKGVLSKTESGPYTLIVSSIDHQPFDVGIYPLTIELKKYSDFKLNRLEYLKVSTLSDNLLINCDFESEINANQEQLKKYLKDKDIYLFTCNLEVKDASILEQAFINIEIKYDLATEYRTTLKTPAVV